MPAAPSSKLVKWVVERSPSGIGPIGPAQATGRRLRDAEQVVAGRHGGPPVACVTGDGVRREQTLADGRRADVSVGVVVRSLDRRAPGPAAGGHGLVSRDERVGRHPDQRRRVRVRRNGHEQHEDEEEEESHTVVLTTVTVGPT